MDIQFEKEYFIMGHCLKLSKPAARFGIMEEAVVLPSDKEEIPESMTAGPSNTTARQSLARFYFRTSHGAMESPT